MTTMAFAWQAKPRPAIRKQEQWTAWRETGSWFAWHWTTMWSAKLKVKLFPKVFKFYIVQDFPLAVKWIHASTICKLEHRTPSTHQRNVPRSNILCQTRSENLALFYYIYIFFFWLFLRGYTSSSCTLLMKTDEETTHPSRATCLPYTRI